VEIVQLYSPDTSYEVLESMSAHVQSLLQKLGLPYRVLRLCGGDMGFASSPYLRYGNLERGTATLAGSIICIKLRDFQSNRLKLRFRNAEGKTQLAHTLNGSAWLCLG
jgi:seryl-tRNA synthetase